MAQRIRNQADEALRRVRREPAPEAPELVLPRQRTLASFKRRDVRNTVSSFKRW